MHKAESIRAIVLDYLKDLLVCAAFGVVLAAVISVVTIILKLDLAALLSN